MAQIAFEQGQCETICNQCSEEISPALKLIKHDVNLLKIDVNFDIPRGPKKKDQRDKLRETIRYLGLVCEKNLSTELPTYQLYLCSMLNAAPRVHKSELNTTNNTNVNNVKSYSVAAGQKHASYSSDASSPKIVHPASSEISAPPSDEILKQGTQSLVDLNVVAAPARSSLSTPNNNINKNKSNSSGHEGSWSTVTSKKKKKYSPITVGSKQPESFKLSAAPLPPKKIVFGVGKLKSCVKEKILEHLETIGLTAAECVPVFKFSPTRPQPSTSIFYKIKYKLSLSALRTLCYTFIYPYLTYCITLWGNSPKSHLNNLILSQKRSIRSIFNLKPDSHTKPFFLAKKNLPLNFICLKLIQTSIKITGLKIWTELVPPYLRAIINLQHFKRFYTLNNEIEFKTSTDHEQD
ncbi:hypothetical protein HELRODRAFT_158328 [Helobdella robusta]|uniref:Uncharacterized protein n=1 Tax=Helobdella robusta TaxID=6412 RepID=T1EMN8_HELRO|nr:hypothetical protein HELRODRAFT_158328 [Helobdella robusta]ESO11964.1 hypothetical protein HELRODRAFT_158328 [Helobdella robusta]